MEPELTEHQEIDWKNNKHVDHFQRELRRFEKRRDVKATEGNQHERALCAQLMLLGTVLVTITGVLASDLSKDLEFSYTSRVLVILAVVSLCISVFAGIRYYFVVIKSYADWAGAEHRIVQFIGSRSHKTPAEMNKKIDSLYEGHEIHTDSFWLKLQIAFLAGAFLIYAVLVLGHLLDLDWLVMIAWWIVAGLIPA